MLEYSIIPISFSNYDEMIDRMNDYGKVGWVFTAKMTSYFDSPNKGVTTQDFICHRKVKWWNRTLESFFN